MKREVRRKVCDCGTLVWDGTIPTPMQWVVCWNCGADHSRDITLGYRLRYIIAHLRYKIRRTRGAYGGVVRYFLKEFYWLPREWEVKIGHQYWDNRPKPEAEGIGQEVARLNNIPT